MNEKDLIKHLESSLEKRASAIVKNIEDKKLLLLADTAFNIVNDDIDNGNSFTGFYDANEVLSRDCIVSIYNYDDIDNLEQGGEVTFGLDVTIGVATKGYFCVNEDCVRENFEVEVEDKYNETQDDEIDCRDFNEGDAERYNKDYNLGVTYEDIYNHSFLDICWDGKIFGSSKYDKFGSDISVYDFDLENIQQDFLDLLQAECPIEIDANSGDVWKETSCGLSCEYDLAKKVVLYGDEYRAHNPNMEIGFSITFTLKVTIENLDFEK